MSVFAISRCTSGLQGHIHVPGDKSISHRALLFGALAEGPSLINGLSSGHDVARTWAAVHAMGAELRLAVGGWRVTGGGRSRLRQPEGPLQAGNSGTTMRLLGGFCASFPWKVRIGGDASLSTRPMDRIAHPLEAMGAVVKGKGERVLPPITIEGGSLRGIDYTLPVPSAQVKSAVLIAGLGAEGETVVRESIPTRAHTEEMLAAFGVDVTSIDGVIRLRPGPIEPFTLDVPGDPSQAAFWVVAAAITPGSDLTIHRVYIGPARAAFLGVLTRMGALLDLERHDDMTADIRVRHSSLEATEVHGAEVAGLIDEIPALAVAAAVATGTTVFRDASELRVKETDRIATVASELAKLGVEVETFDDGLAVTGGKPLVGAPTTSHGDHRVAMAMAVAGLVASGTTRVEGWEAVDTSYPDFDEELGLCAS
ncbi:MAG: 3-phosphoshikimate 1-carboxyvinyltransferase [Actinomycetota bacterium]|jgi:3-phosphoshikimate 1-carboxyvinyltransferase|nr:3-phosphoshikimate 1-carboxyvinyltransferase [Actinomycetota bacterium]